MIEYKDFVTEEKSSVSFPEDQFSVFDENVDNNFWYILRSKILEWIVKKFIDPNPTFKYLEIGCGTGVVLAHFEYCLPRADLSGVELSKHGLQFCKNRIKRSRLYRARFESLPQHFANQFDIVGVFDVIEHLENDLQHLNYFSQILKPKGFILFTVPQHQWLWSEVDEVNGHYRRYSYDSISKLLKEGGFEIKFISSFALAVFPISILQRIILWVTPQAEPSFKNWAKRSGLIIPKPINWLLGILSRLDLFLLSQGLSLPWGTSIVCLAQKKT